MKIVQSILALALILSVPLMTQAQVDRSKAPAPGPAPKIELGKYQNFELDNGLKVIVVENNKLPRIAFNLRLDIDPILEGETAGTIDLAGSLLSHGTTNRSKADLDEEIDFIGANISASSTGIFASSLTKHSDKLLELMTDMLYNPSFPKEELEKLKKQTISGLASAKNDANAIAGNVGSALRFGLDHPYGEQVTEETVERATVEKCREYYNTYFKPNVAYLVIVGDIKAKDAKKLAEKHFGSWKKGEVPTHKYNVPTAPSKTRVAFVHKPGAVQSVINVTYPVDLQPGDMDLVKANVMNSILGGGIFSGRLMQNLREDKAYTYGARSSLSANRVVGEFRAFASVRNEVTDSAVVEFLHEMKRIRDERVTPEELSLTKSSMNGGFARSLEQPQTVARFALNLSRYNLPADYYDTYLERLSQVTAEDVQNKARKYIRPDNAIILVVGNRAEVAEKLARFAGSGEVEYFDMYGNVFTEALRPAPAGLTAQNVVDNYLKAIGGKEKLLGVKDMTSVLGASMQGMQMEMTLMQKSPNKYKMELGAMGQTFQKMVFNGESGFQESMGQRADLAGDELEKMKYSSTLNIEARYAEMGFKLELLGIEDLKSGAAYKVAITDPLGNKETVYFNEKTGYKVQSVEMQDSPGGPVEAVSRYEDYKDVDGIKIPHKMIQVQGPMEVTFEAKSITVNNGLEDTTFQ